MCIYTYHHYPLCGHISNWSVTSCLEFTNQLRLLHGTGDVLCCDDVEVTHDLHPTAPHSLCAQCDFDWTEAMTSQDPDALQPKIYRNIEGLDAKYPVIEFAVRMTVDVTDNSSARSTDTDKSDVFASLARENAPGNLCCHSSSQKISPNADRVTQASSNGMVPTTEGNSDSVNPLGLQGEAASQPETGEELQTDGDELPRPEALTADILRALAQSHSTDVVTDTPSVYSRDSNACSSDGNASTTSTDTMELLRRRNAPADGHRLWHHTLSDASSLHLIGRARYGWLSELDFASAEISRHLDEVEGRVRARSETGNAESSSQSPSPGTGGNESSETRAYKASRSRPGTPYADMGSQHSTPRRLIAAASEQEALELGLRCPLRIGNLYAGF